MNARRNVLPLNLALSDSNGEVLLTDGPESSVNRVLGHTPSGKRCIKVRCRRLDSLCADLNILPNVVKIDVEGHEARVIHGFRENLRRATLLFLEGGEKPEIRSVMSDNHFVGPLYFHQDMKSLSPFQQRRAEDPVYVSLSGLEDLRLLDIRVTAR